MMTPEERAKKITFETFGEDASNSTILWEESYLRTHTEKIAQAIRDHNKELIDTTNYLGKLVNEQDAELKKLRNIIREMEDVHPNHIRKVVEREREAIISWIQSNHYHEDDLIAMIRARGDTQ